MAPPPLSVLFLCTGNSARSLLAEALLNHMGQGRFRAFSAGSHPKGQAHALTGGTLAAAGIAASGLRSKSWDEFARPDAPRIDLVITVCDGAAGEVCPLWPGRPVTAHWGLPDPAAPEIPERDQPDAFRAAYRALEERIRDLTALPAEGVSAAEWKRRLAAVHRRDALPGS